MVGYNDTLQTPHDFGGRADEQMWSFGPLGLQLWNSIRALDFVESLPEVDPLKLAATGASGGGTQAFLLAAIDDRVRFAAPVNMVSAIMQGGSPCENAPGLRVGAYNVEYAAMMAPRPLLLVSATGDWTRNVPKEEFPDVRRIYDLYDKPKEVEVVQFEAQHNFNRASREAVYRFFAKRMLASDAPVAETNAAEERVIDMLALHGRTLPETALSFGGVFEQWRKMSERQSGAMSEDDLRARLRDVLGAAWPAKVSSERRGESVVLSREGAGDRVSGIWLPGKSGRAALVVHPAGAVAARDTAEVKKLVGAGDSVLLIDAFQTSGAAPTRDRSVRHFLTFNRSDDALRVQDVLTALAFLTREQSGEVQLIGVGEAGAWCLYAAAIAPARVKLAPPTDAGDRFFAPGILRAGGTAVARRLAGLR